MIYYTSNLHLCHVNVLKQSNRSFLDIEKMNEVIKDIRNICGAAYCAILNIDGLAAKCSLLCEDVSPDFVDYNPGWFT